MTHPDELLAEYVDGALAGADRARVEEHLSECARCREEVALATEARSAVSELDEVASPSGLSTAIRREIRGRRAAGRGWRVVAAVAVAAGVAAGGVLVVGSLGEDGPATRLERAGAPDPAPAEAQDEAGELGKDLTAATGTGLQTAGGAPEVTASQTDYEPAALASLGRRLRDDARTALEQGFPATASDYYRQFDTSAFAPQTRRAVRCALADIPPEQAVVPLVIEEATFQGSPAYVAAFLQGPAPDQPYDRILIWVADRDSCALRSLASQQL